MAHLMRRVATLGAAVAAARQYARQNPEKVNRYADQAASFIDKRTQGRFRKQIDGALRQVRKETSVPGRPQPGSSQAGQYGPQQYRAPQWNDPNATRPPGGAPYGDQRYGSNGQGGSYYPSERTDR